MMRIWWQDLRFVAAAVALLVAPGAGAVAELTEPDRPVRVQNRVLLKEGRAFLTVGPTLLDRADYHLSPGLVATATWFWSEKNGLELRAGWLFSRVTASGNEVIEQTGLVLEAPLPRALVLGGWRHAFGYGKVLVGSTVVHFDVTAGAHGGALYTRGGTAPALALAPGVLVRAGPGIFAAVDVAALGTWEPQRRTPFHLGLLPSLSVGVQL
jgi:hypothetical protein